MAADEKEVVVGPACLADNCSESMTLPWVGENRVSIVGVDGWTFTTDAGWRCPAHSGGNGETTDG